MKAGAGCVWLVRLVLVLCFVSECCNMEDHWRWYPDWCTGIGTGIGFAAVMALGLALVTHLAAFVW